MKSWLILDSGAAPAACNMALDEALLNAMPRLQTPVLRFYEWTEGGASFGYFQKYSDVERMTRLRPLVRRPTGGGVVPHDTGWTYSLVFPAGHEWHELTATESYRRTHEWLQAALARLNLPTEVASQCRKADAGQCFAGHEKFDLLAEGKKIAGAAQRRNRDGLLVQGSIQPPRAWSQTDWRRAMRAVGASSDRNWTEFTPDTELRRRATDLMTEKYSQDRYNRKR